MSSHAKLSPSGAHRWMRCPGSVDAEAPIPDRSSIYADEGSRAHALGEACLRTGLNTLDPSLALDGVDEDMQYNVQIYVDHVRAVAAEVPGSLLLVEQKLAISEYVPESYGTSDALVFQAAPGRPVVGHVFDLKYGKGIRVSAAENEQMMLYALGADQEYGFALDVEEWVLWIVQPRLDAVSSWRITAEELRQWGRDRVKPAALAALTPGAPLVPGPKQCQWCKAAPVCRALKDHAVAVAREEFAVLPPDHLTPAELGELLPKLKVMESWAESVRQYAYTLAASGTTIPGYKLVSGNANRAWADETAVADTLVTAGVDPWQPSKLIGIPAAEKALKARKLNPAEVLSGLIIKPAGAPSLVPETDPRPVLSLSAASEFQPLEPWEY